VSRARTARRRRAAAPAPAGADAGVTGAVRRRGPLSPAALAVAGKDARYLWRDPQLKASLLSSLVVLLFVFLPTFGGGGQGASILLQPVRVLYAPLPALIVALNLSLNSLGMERQGLQMLYLFPVRPLDVFWGKNLTVGAITFGAQVVLAVGLAALTGGWYYVPLALAAGLAAILVLMACGNVTSVLIPFRVREFRAGRTSLSSDNGCLRSLLSMLTLAVAAALLAPVAVALIVPLVLDQRALLLAALPAAVLYGVALHQIATRVIAPYMLRRAPEILAATIRE
jgi:ABC-2 type transport system permease protein